MLKSNCFFFGFVGKLFGFFDHIRAFVLGDATLVFGWVGDEHGPKQAPNETNTALINNKLMRINKKWLKLRIISTC